MAKQVPFINREGELAFIDKLISEWGTRRILCISAPGGIGKTRLLQEIRQQYRKGGNGDFPLIITDIVDFDDRTFHLPENLGRHIAVMLDEKVFEPYLRMLLDLHRMDTAGVSSERLLQETLAVDKSFVDYFNKVSAQRRVVLLLDTTDALEGIDILNFLIGIESQLNNSILLIAGRNARDVGESLKTEVGEDVQTIVLPPLQEQASKSYLQQKQELLHMTLEPELVQKLLILAGGRPILIDLAVEWLAREIPLDWLVKMSLEEIRSLPDDEKQELQREFERRLVHHITDTRRLIDWLILVMSRVYPLDVEMIAKLLAIPEDEAGTLFEEVQSYVFVKWLPDGRISLHDEMRRMVNEYVWPEVDPDNDRRRRDSRLVVEYLESKIQIFTERIEQLQVEEKIAHKEANPQAELSAFMAHEPLERELWVLKRQLLDHILFVNIDDGVKTFVKMFDEASRDYRFSFRETLLTQTRPYVDQLSPRQMYEVDSRRIKFLKNYGNYLRARDLVIEILDRGGISPEQQVNMLIEYGNIEIRLGNIEKGIADFERAVQISKEHNLQKWLVRALNAWGWAYRIYGDLDKALDNYSQAYLFSVRLDDLEQTALILNNMSYVHALKGNRKAAFENCKVAVNLFEEMGLPRKKGFTYSTLGEIYRLFDQLEEAMNSYNKALDIFERENDVEWISTVRCERASVLRLQEELDKAEDELNWALKYGPTSLKPRVLYYQAEVYQSKNELETARQKSKECRMISREIGDKFYDYSSFSLLIDLAWEFGEYDRWREFNDEQRNVYADRESEMDLALQGTALRRIGDLALCNGEYEAALTIYKEGLLLIDKYTVRERYSVGEQIRITDKRIRERVSGDVLNNLGKDLTQFWKDHQELVTKYPEVLLTFQRWERKGGDGE